MLETSLFESGGNSRTRKPATLMVSTAIHATVVVALIVVPLIKPDQMSMFLAAAAVPLPPPPAPPTRPEIQTRRAPEIRTSVIPAVGDLIAPVSIPLSIAAGNDPAVGSESPLLPVDRFVVSLLPGTADSAAASATLPAPPPPPPPAKPAASGPVRISNMEPASLLERVQPVYPALAKQVRVQGVVLVEATISKEGAVENVRVISGHPLLTQAAVDAVQQWRYRPTILNGEPVEVLTTVAITFSLR